MNPGPTYKYPCGHCNKPVKRNQKGIQCDGCDFWLHTKCIEMPDVTYHNLAESTEDWFCNNCLLPQFTDSFFSSMNSTSTCDTNTENLSTESAFILDPDVNIETESSVSPDASTHSSDEQPPDAFQQLRDIKKKHSKNVIIAHVNINSIRNKFFELSDLLYDKIPDILFLSETKLDDTFSQNQFNVPGYRLFRNDRNIHGGGVICYVKSTLPARRRPDLEF